MIISLYKNAYESITEHTTTIKEYFSNIRSGLWQDSVLGYRTGKLKKELSPAVTPSGFFPTKRENDKLKSHSGIICLDFDDKNNENLLEKRDEIYADNYLLCGHISIGGKGLALYFKINKTNHLGSFLALEKYLANKYHIISDPSCKNVSRLRFVSYDPDLFLNENSEKWIEVYEKKKVQPFSYSPVYAENDIDFIFSQIEQQHLDLTYDYHSWINLGFAFCSEFGERGRDYFHRISRYNSGYDYEKCNKKYDTILKSGSKSIKINTFFWTAKTHGLKIKTPQTKKIQQITTIRKKEIGQNGGSFDLESAKKSTMKYLNEIENIPQKEAEKIVSQILEQNTNDKDEESNGLEIIVEYVKTLKLKYNSITQRIEFDNVDLTDRIENSIYLNAKKLFPKEKFSKDFISNIINSDRIVEYNPFLDFIEKNKHLKPTGNIDKLLKCILVQNDLSNDYKMLCSTLIYKWLVSIIASIHGVYSLLILVFVGEQMTNKTNFFRFLLPDELQRYYGETKMDRDKDDEILMSQKLILIDDEFAGKSKKEATKLKELSSKQIITARKSYGKYAEDYKRIAVLGGTSNELDIINDTTGNRRVLPILIHDIIIEKYKNIDKTELFMELYLEWRKIGNDWMLTKDEVTKLNELTEQFNEISLEEELIKKSYRKPFKDEVPEFYTATEMLNHCETFLVKQKLYHKLFGKVLRKLGFDRVQRRGVGFGYAVIKIN